MEKKKIWRISLTAFLLGVVGTIIYCVFWGANPFSFDAYDVGKIRIRLDCFLPFTSEWIDGEATITEREDIGDVVHKINHLPMRQKEFKEEYISGEALGATVTLYDKQGKEIESIVIYDDFIHYQEKDYKVYFLTYKKIQALCEKYGECKVEKQDIINSVMG